MSRLIVSWLLSQYGVQISELEGVLEVKEAHFWTLCSGEYHGSLRLEITGGTDSQRTVATTRSILTQVEKGLWRVFSLVPRPPPSFPSLVVLQATESWAGAWERG